MQVAAISAKPIMTLVDLAARKHIQFLVEDRPSVVRMFRDGTSLVARTTASIRLITTHLASRLLSQAGCPKEATYFANLNQAVPGTAYNTPGRPGNDYPPEAPPPELRAPAEAPPAARPFRAPATLAPAPRPRPTLEPAPARGLVTVRQPVRPPATDMAGRFLAQLRQRDAEVRRHYSLLPMPAVVPEYDLDEEQMEGDYGLSTAPPAFLESETSNYIRHCMVDINPDRGDAWNAPIQSTSVHGTRQVIKGFVGFCNEYRDVPHGELRLSLFANPDHIIHFVGFLKARNVGKGQLAKQVCGYRGGGGRGHAGSVTIPMLLKSAHPDALGDGGQEGERLPEVRLLHQQ